MPVESMHGFRIGDQVYHRRVQAIGTILSFPFDDTVVVDFGEDIDRSYDACPSFLTLAVTSRGNKVVSKSLV